ncbi:MAG: hypothetical protein ACLGGX_08515 [Bdellovibrionia bacterium]
MKKALLLLVVSSLFSGCAYLNSVSLTSIPKERNNPIKVSKEKWIILGFNFDNDFVDEMNEEIHKQCPQGRATGLLTKDEAYLFRFT